jgi:Fe-S cluster biogenesis protein NfuA
VTEGIETTSDGVESGDAVANIELEPLTDAEYDRRKVDLESLIEMLRAGVVADGGDLKLIEVDYLTGVVEVMLVGSCSSCAIAGVTLEGGVDRILKENLDWVTEVKGGVDENADPLVSAAAGRGAYVPRYY